MERLLTLKEVSAILGRPDDKDGRFVRDLRRNGILEGAKIGKRLLFRESAVQSYIDEQFRLQNK